MARSASSARGWRALEADPRAIIDFPAPAGSPEPRARLCFGEPQAELIALVHAEVPHVLAQAEELARAGQWVVGLVRYDAGPAFDPAMRVIADEVSDDWPLAWFGVFDGVQTIPRWHSLAPGGVEAPAMKWVPQQDEVHHANAVNGIRAAILAGDVYQVNHTLRLRAAWDGSGALGMYEHLRLAQPGGYSAWIDLGRRRVLSASPELFFEVHDRAVRTRPMKGTAPRGRWPEEDDRAAATLRSSPKERAENVMIVDLIRNDLGRVAETGSVRVTSMFEVERYPTVLQMTSTVEARLRDDVRLPEVFAALFPCGSVTGAPKIAAMQQIAAREGVTRGAYCGAIGVLRPGGDCTFNVAIRTVVLDADAGVAEYGTGGGITIDSTAEGEHRELLAKAAVLGAAALPAQLLETMRLEHGVIPRMERHLARLHDSARYFGFAPPAGARDALTAAAAAHVSGVHRLRLLAGADGAVSVEVSPFAEDRAPAAPPQPHAVALAHAPVSSRDVLLFHKTTSRATYERHRAEQPDAWDVILWNERGELTELTIGNLVVELDGYLVTPPRECGLLAGTMRAELLERGEIRERVLTAEDLSAASALWLVNSLRGRVPLTLRP